jgi:hypothetical protein
MHGLLSNTSQCSLFPRLRSVIYPFLEYMACSHGSRFGIRTGSKLRPLALRDFVGEHSKRIKLSLGLRGALISWYAIFLGVLL